MKEQILIVEDEADTAELLRYNLEKNGYMTVLARNGEEGIDHMQCNTPDLVLLDVMMPGLNGWEVCRVLRESSKGKSLPIIMLSALVSDEARVKGLSLGADDYIAKPFSINEVLLKIGKYLKQRRDLRRFQSREQEQETSLRYLVHELRNAMTAIGGYSTLALKNGQLEKYLSTIKTSAFYVESLLRDTALLSRLEKNEQPLRVEPVDIGSLIHEVIDMFEQTIEMNNTEILFFYETPAWVLANRTAMKQVLINLITNAVKYNRDQGRIWLSLEESQDSVDVKISDEGIGIAPTELSKVFDKYYRCLGTEQIKGAGMGLYIVRALLKAMSGTVRVTSRLGAGSTFIVSLMSAKNAEKTGRTKTLTSAS